MKSDTNAVTVAAHGAWKSPITADMAIRQAPTLAEVKLRGGAVYWLETRPEQGTTALMRADPVGVCAITPENFDVQTRVHGYGGGAYAVGDGFVIVSGGDQDRLYRLDLDGMRAITAEPPATRSLRYADFDLSADGRWCVCVREQHDPHTVSNDLVLLPTDGSGPPVVLASGEDFYSAPRISPDGTSLAWVSWNRPDMPWDSSRLWTARLSATGSTEAVTLIAGRGEESVCQPAWSPCGVLHFLSDSTGWWNLYRVKDGKVEALAPMEEECAAPQWLLGMSSYAFLDDGRIACIHGVGAVQSIAIIDPVQRTWTDLDLPCNAFYPPYLSSEKAIIATIAGGPTIPQGVLTHSFPTGATKLLARASVEAFDPRMLSRPEPITVPTTGGDSAHALYYPPTNPAYAAEAGQRPPLLVMSHGGPTDQTSNELSLSVQFWTSRGFAVVRVDYRGSSGYGRAYRRRLNGHWGIFDVEDCIAAARGLGERVDQSRLLIRGVSAGGFTTLAALTFHDVFAAGTSWYGVADAEQLVRDTHKFESTYLHGLIGPYPQASRRYRDRSPVHHVDQLRRPILIIQGTEDDVVPPNQAQAIARALHAAGVRHQLMLFPGEGHGFRHAENLRVALEAELAFYLDVLGIPLPPPQTHTWPAADNRQTHGDAACV